MKKASVIVDGIGVIASVLGIVATLMTSWANEKKMDNKIEEKVNEALENKRIEP